MMAVMIAIDSDLDAIGGPGPDDIPDDIAMSLIDEDYDYGSPL